MTSKDKVFSMMVKYNWLVNEYKKITGKEIEVKDLNIEVFKDMGKDVIKDLNMLNCLKWWLSGMDDKGRQLLLINNLKFNIENIVEISALEGAECDSEYGERIIVGSSIDELKTDLINFLFKALIFFGFIDEENFKNLEK